MSLLRVCPSFTFLVLLPDMLNLKLRKRSCFKTSSLRNSFSFFFFRSDMDDTATYRVIILVLTGSFAPALRSAARACSSGTPSTSKSIRPGSTSAWNPCGSPLPFPIPTSAAFLVNGLSGNILIQIFPPLARVLLSVRRAASI